MAYSVFNQHKKLLLSLTFFIMFGISLQIFAAPPTNPYSQGETLDPSCTPGSANCIVSIIPDQTGNNGKYLTTDGTTTSWVSLSGSGISSLNGLTGATQTFAVGTSGTDFNISSTSTTHTFNIPDAGASARGLVTTGTQTFAGSKTFSSLPTFSSLTAGSLMFAGTSGIVAQDNSNLFWDDSLNNLGIGTTAPKAMLHLAGSTSPSSGYQFIIENTAPAGTYNEGKNTGNARVLIGVDGANNPAIQLNRGENLFTQASGEMYFDWAWADNVVYDFRFAVADSSTFQVKSLSQKNFIFDNLNVGIGDLSPASLFTVGSGDKFQIDSDGNIIKINNITYSWPSSQAGGVGYVLSNDSSGALSWVANNATLSIGSGITSASSGSILFTGGSNQLAQDNSNFFWDDFNNRLGIGTISPVGALSVGSTSPFVVDSNGNIISINGVTYSWPGSQAGGAGYVLSNDGSGILSWVPTSGGLSAVSVSGSLLGDGTPGNPLGINQSTSGSDGYLSSADWINFNGKQNALSFTTGAIPFADGTGALTSNTSALFFDENNARLGIGNNSPSSLLSVGSTAGFNVDTNGDIVSINGITYSWPASQGSNGDVLSNNGSGTLSWVSAGVATMSIGSAITSATSGSILFADSSNQLAQNNSNLFWDDTNKNFGVMTTSPQASLHIAGAPFLSSFQLAIERGAVAGTYGGANTGNARFLFGVDALSNPGIEIMRGKTSLAQASSALYWDWSWSDDVDNDFRLYIEDANIFHIAGNTGTGSKLLKLDDMSLTVDESVTFAGLGSTVGSGDALCIDPISNVVSRDSSGACAVSSQRFKHDITSLQLNALDTVNALHSVTFKYNGTDKIRTGFIAEEVEQVNKDYVVYEADGITPHGVYYIDMIPLLAKSIQELDLKINPITSLDIENPNSLGALIKQFLANTQNTILDLYAQIIHADRVETKQLCIGETCVDENQLKQLLQQGGGSSGGAPIVNPNPPVDDTVQSNEVITQDSNESDSEPQTETVPDPEVQTEPQPEPEPIPVIENIPQNDTPVVAE